MKKFCGNYILDIKKTKSLRLFLDKSPSLAIYYFCIRIYFNYRNLAWVITNRTHLEKFKGSQKHVIGIIFNDNRFELTGELFLLVNILNI